jgi:hypothetical protein
MSGDCCSEKSEQKYFLNKFTKINNICKRIKRFFKMYELKGKLFYAKFFTEVFF